MHPSVRPPSPFPLQDRFAGLRPPLARMASEPAAKPAALVDEAQWAQRQALLLVAAAGKPLFCSSCGQRLPDNWPAPPMAAPTPVRPTLDRPKKPSFLQRISSHGSRDAEREETPGSPLRRTSSTPALPTGDQWPTEAKVLSPPVSPKSRPEDMAKYGKLRDHYPFERMSSAV